MRAGTRIGGVAGILFVIVALAGSVAQRGLPAWDESGNSATAWFSDNHERYLAGQFVSGLGFLVFKVPFLAALVERLQGAEGQPRLWSRVAFAGGILFPVGGIAGGLPASRSRYPPPTSQPGLRSSRSPPVRTGSWSPVGWARSSPAAQASASSRSVYWVAGWAGSEPSWPWR